MLMFVYSAKHEVHLIPAKCNFYSKPRKIPLFERFSSYVGCLYYTNSHA